MPMREESVFLQTKGNLVSLDEGVLLGVPGEQIERVYAVYSGLVSVVTPLENGDQVQTGMVGPKGLVGAGVVAGGKWPNMFVTQSPVTAWEMATDDFIDAMRSIPSLHELAFRHVQWVMVQAQQSAACNAKHRLEHRLSTWLLRAHDLTQWTLIPFTQQTIADLLGRQRASASTVLHHMKEQGLRACECYWVLRQRREELFVL
jgi:CRP-like cAMP-binding protein